MPALIWPSKTPPEPVPASLQLDSLVYPGGTGFPSGAGYPDSIPSSRLIHGDNLAVMSALLPVYQGRVKLIYADPPFFTNKAYPARIGQGEDSRRPQEWQLAAGYPDAWADLDAYLDMLYPRLALMYRLLAEDGALYLHLDWHANAYARLLLDEIFGAERLLNEIVWIYHGPSPIRSAFKRKHDTILVYTKSERYTFNADAVRQPYNPNTVKTFASSPKAGFGKQPDLARGKVPEDWWYFPVVARLHSERTGYPTQKPQALLERILLASSNPGDLTADFFCGSGTLPLVAARLERQFLASDLAWRAVHTTRSRLAAAGALPFTLEREAGAAPPPRPGGSPNLHLEVSAGQVGLVGSDLEEILFWEIDPDFDGNLFRSSAQAARPRQKAPVPARLPLNAPPHRLAARLLDLSGAEHILYLTQHAV